MAFTGMGGLAASASAQDRDQPAAASRVLAGMGGLAASASAQGRGQPAARRDQAVARMAGWPWVPAQIGLAILVRALASGVVLTLTRAVWLQMVGHAYDGLPDEACGLLAGPAASSGSSASSASVASSPSVASVASADGAARVFYPCRNAAESSRVYTVDPHDHLRADRDAESRGLEIIGVMHSHTHTEAYPSPTDVDQAPDPGWHYVIVSLKREEPVLRSYRIVDGEVTEEAVSLAGR